MTVNYSDIDFHKFVNENLEKHGFKVQLITKDLMLERLDDFMNFVNNIRLECKNLYGWETETREYFLKDMVDKWKYSHVITDKDDCVAFINFSSVYGNRLHTHCFYAGKNTRNLNLAKLHMIKLAQTGLENGYTKQGGYWPKNNNGSIILYLRMG